VEIIHGSDDRLRPGTNFCKCAACGAYFGGLRAFEMHRDGPAGERRCLALSGMRDGQEQPLLRLNGRGYWVRIFEKSSSPSFLPELVEYVAQSPQA